MTVFADWQDHAIRSQTMQTAQERIEEIRRECHDREAKITAMWPNHSTVEIARTLGMSRGAVSSAASRNGLTAADRVQA